MNLQAEAVLSYGSSWIEFRASKHGQFVISDFAAIIKSADIINHIKGFQYFGTKYFKIE
jgi:hypothetical protein